MGEDAAKPGTIDPVKLSTDVPRWDAKLRQLSFDRLLVKQFRLPARNQEAVLSAFEEEGWPWSVYDPLPYLLGQRERIKERLRVTIRHLNANHRNRLIRFRGNGTGEAVLWEPIAASAIERPTIPVRVHRAV